MSTFNGYQCDKCKTEFLALPTGGYAEPPVFVGVNINIGYPYAANHTPGETWCRKCVMAARLEVPRTEEERKAMPVEPRLTVDQAVEVTKRWIASASNTDIDDPEWKDDKWITASKDLRDRLTKAAQ